MLLVRVKLFVSYWRKHSFIHVWRKEKEQKSRVVICLRQCNGTGQQLFLNCCCRKLMVLKRIYILKTTFKSSQVSGQLDIWVVDWWQATWFICLESCCDGQYWSLLYLSSAQQFCNNAPPIPAQVLICLLCFNKMSSFKHLILETIFILWYYINSQHLNDLRLYNVTWLN